MPDTAASIRRLTYMFGLVLAGEAVFVLPFHIARFFRPTALEVFALTNTELGAAQGAYGVLAMVSYFFGGPLADRFAARKLLATSLWSTAAGGLYMATFPGYRGALLLWGFFGVTTILFFWAALIRATREWGGHDSQGRAYGLLDGGRGLLAAVLASVAVAVFGLAFPEGYAAATFDEKQAALRMVILGYTAATALAGVLVWYALADARSPGTVQAGDSRARQESAGNHVLRVLRMPAVWLQSIIVVCAYVGFKGFDFYAVYAVDAYGVDEVEAARIVAIGSWMRPLAALGAGLLGDRYTISRMTVISFALLLLSQLYFALATPVSDAVWVLLGNTLLTCTAIFALRGLYFALFEEAKVPAAVTGTAVGLVSMIGFTPEVFVAFVGGVLLDRSPGFAGYQHLFLFLGTFSLLGLAVSIALMRMLHAANRPLLHADTGYRK